MIIARTKSNCPNYNYDNAEAEADIIIYPTDSGWSESTVGGTLACRRIEPASQRVCEICRRHCVLFRQSTNNEPYVAAFVGRRTTYSCYAITDDGGGGDCATDVWRIIKSDGGRKARCVGETVIERGRQTINSS